MDVCVRIVDNLPITWCYLTDNSQTYCSTGFPIGCFNNKTGPNKNGCSYLVGTFINHIETQTHWLMSCLMYVAANHTTYYGKCQVLAKSKC